MKFFDNFMKPLVGVFKLDVNDDDSFVAALEAELAGVRQQADAALADLQQLDRDLMTALVAGHRLLENFFSLRIAALGVTRQPAVQPASHVVGAEVVAKMVDGAVAKFVKENALLNQLFVIDGKTKISDVVAAAAKEAGASIVLKDYVRFQLGEGIEKKESDFAAEVAAAAGV